MRIVDINVFMSTMMLLLIFSFIPTVYAGYLVHPSLDNDKFIVYVEDVVGGGGLESYNTSSVFPPSFRISYSGEYDKVVNGWWCPQWWEDSCKPEKYRYSVERKDYMFLTKHLPQVIEYNGGRFLLTYFTSISVIPYATRTWYGWMEEHVKVVVSVQIYGRIDRQPTTTGDVDLGALIRKEIGRDNLQLAFDVRVKRTSPSQAVHTFSDSFDLSLSGIVLSFYKLYATSIHAKPRDAKPVGNFGENGYIMVAPVGDINVRICFEGKPGYTLGGELLYYTPYGTAKSDIILRSGKCDIYTIHDAVLVPGNYSGDNKLTVTFRSGAFSINLRGDAEIEGAMISASTPMAVLIPLKNMWVAEVYVGVDYRSYNSYSPGKVHVSGVIDVGGHTLVLGCREMEFRSSGVYVCNTTYSSLPIDPKTVSTAMANLKVTVKLYGKENSDKVSVDCAIVSPTNVYGVVYELYSFLVYLSTGIACGIVLLFIISKIAEFFDITFVDPYLLMRSLYVAVILAVFVLGLPYMYWVVLKTLYMFPEFRDVLVKTPISDPDMVLSMKPYEVLSAMFGYYDLTFSQMKIDYKLWVEVPVVTSMVPRIIAVGALIFALIALALILIISGNSAVAGAPLMPIISFITTCIGIVLFMMPSVGVTLAVVSLAEAVVEISAVLFLIATLLGAIMIIIPSPVLQKYGEGLVGGGILYLFSSPLFAPIIYAIYENIMTQLNMKIGELESYLAPINIILGPYSLFITPPVGTVMRIATFIMSASLASLSIVFLHTFILTRTGLMGAIGEGLMRLARR